MKDKFPIEYQHELHEKVWKEGKELRSTGKLLALAQKLSCPVVAIHGDYDPHPHQGVKEPLSAAVKNFRFILLEHCGHYPWFEKEAKQKFYKILEDEISG